MNRKIERKAKRELIEMSFMRSKTKGHTIEQKPRSMLEMTREEFESRLVQHKTKAKADNQVH